MNKKFILEKNNILFLPFVKDILRKVYGIYRKIKNYSDIFKHIKF